MAREYLDTLHPLVGGIKVEWLVRHGHPGEEIVTCAHDTGADLVVMSTHGRSGLSRLVMGSTAEFVMRHAHIPVMTWRAAAVKTPQPATQPETHLTPTA
ncbi:MAG TPA: universal stress protein, partial [Candidatus Xenobia bacterium]|jgi:nucleotide-binding universal stress UspA family protein